MSDWISVQNKLPEEHSIVDVFDSDENRWIEVEFYNDNFFSGEQDFSVDDCGYGCFKNTFLVENVTHWMPLPEPPKRLTAEVNEYGHD